MPRKRISTRPRTGTKYFARLNLLAAGIATFVAPIAQAAAGDPLGTAFTIDSADTYLVDTPYLACAPDGSFVVAWTRYDYSSDSAYRFQAYLRRYAADGSPLGEAQALAATGADADADVWAEGVAIDAQHRAVVTLQRRTDGPWSHRYQQQFRMIGADGTLGKTVDVGAPISPVLGDFSTLSVAMDADGDFVLGERSKRPFALLPTFYYGTFDAAALTNTYVERRHSDGTRKGATTLVDVTAVTPYRKFNGNSDQPAVAIDDTGDFLVVYTDRQSASSERPQLLARRYSAAGLPSGRAQTLRSAPELYSYTDVTAAVGANGYSWVGFKTRHWPATDTDVYTAELMQLDASGAATDVSFALGQADLVNQLGGPVLAADPTGAAVAAWSQQGQIQLKFFSAAGAATATRTATSTYDWTGATTTDYRSFDVAADGQGNPVLVWLDVDHTLKGQRYFGH